MKVRRKPEFMADEAIVFNGMKDFNENRAFLSNQIRLKCYSFDNKGKILGIQTECGTITAGIGDVVLKTPNGVLSVMKQGHFRLLYEESTRDKDIDREKETRARICRVLLEYFKAKGIKSMAKVEQTLKRFACIDKDEVAETAVIPESPAEDTEKPENSEKSEKSVESTEGKEVKSS